ncbi:MAG: Maf family protein [Actinomycetes bacterium]
MTRRRVVLASASPRRAALLATLGVQALVAVAEVDESPRPGESPGALVRRLADAKARAVAASHPGAVVLGGDTEVVAPDGRTLGKPVDRDDARRILAVLAGSAVRITSGVAVALPDGRVLGGRADAVAHVDPLDAATLDAYLATGEADDAAGALAIQGAGAALVSRVVGCWPAVVGLPTCMAGDLLAAAGVAVHPRACDHGPRRTTGAGGGSQAVPATRSATEAQVRQSSSPSASRSAPEAPHST